LRTGRRFPMRFGSWIASGPSHFDYLTPRKTNIAITAKSASARLSLFLAEEKNHGAHVSIYLAARGIGESEHVHS
jgi:hypothetical protein